MTRTIFNIDWNFLFKSLKNTSHYTPYTFVYGIFYGTTNVPLKSVSKELTKNYNHTYYLWL